MKRLERKHPPTVVAGLLFTIVVIIGLMFWSGQWKASGKYEVTAFVPNARTLGNGAHVLIAGLDAGKVTSVDRRGANAILRLRIDRGPTPLPADSHVAVRLRSLVGESYVEVRVGKARNTIRDGGSLPVTQADELTDIDQVLSTLSGSTRERAREMVQALAGAVGGRGEELNGTVRSASDLVTNAAPVLTTLGRQHEDVGKLVENLGSVMKAVSDRQQALVQMARGSRETLIAVADRDAALRSILDELPSTLRQVRTTSTTVRQVTPRIAPVMRNLARAVRDLSPTVEALGPAARNGTRVVTELGAAAKPLRGVLRNLNGLSKPTVAAMPRLHAAMCELSPVLRYLQPFGPELASFFQNFGMAANYYDATGHAARVFADVLPQMLPAVQTPETAAAIKFLTGIGFLGKLQHNGYNPFPKPGTLDNPAGAGLLNRGEASKVMTYQRVQADCEK
jgi:phospholipid/cholesterol/gamma-HCH transport system substrate-binding protein